MVTRPHFIITELYNPPVIRQYPGGGGGTYPRTEYKRHAEKIFHEAEKIKTALAKVQAEINVRKLHYRLETPEDINVWTSQGEKIADSIHGQIVGSPESNIAHISTNQQSFDLLLEELENYRSTPTNTGKSKFAPIESIGLIPAKEKISARLKGVLETPNAPAEVVFALFPDLLREDKNAYKLAIEAYLLANSGKIIGATDSDVGLLIRVNAKSEIVKSCADKFMGIYSVDPLSHIFFNSSVQGAKIADEIEIVSNYTNAKVAIFDSGVVKKSRFLDTAIIGYEEPMGPPVDEDHGTFVSSRIVYGDNILDQMSQDVLRPDVKVLSVCVFPKDEFGKPRDSTEEDLVSVIRDTVERWHTEIKVYNLSLNLVITTPGTIQTVTDDTIGTLAAELDFLARKFGVLFIITTGNLNSQKPQKDYPHYFEDEDTRILPPAESMLSITVGALSLKENAGSVSKTNHPSPFTRRGPGFQGYRKPDVVAHGGNLTQSWKHLNELATVGISKDGQSVAYDNGTSHAAPLIARLAAHIFSKVPNCSQELVRAFLVHFGKILSTPDIPEELLLKLVGNGIPESEELLTSDSWNQTFFFQGKIDFRNICRVPFYVPKSLIEQSGRQKVRIKYTVAYSPETARTLKSGYCKSNLRVKICKIGRDGQLAEVTPGESVSEISDRYTTIKRGEKFFCRGITPGDWAILLEHQSRWKLSSNELPFALVITVSDPNQSAEMDIYSAIRAEVPNRYRNELVIREKIRI